MTKVSPNDDKRRALAARVSGTAQPGLICEQCQKMISRQNTIFLSYPSLVILALCSDACVVAYCDAPPPF